MDDRTAKPSGPDERADVHAPSAIQSLRDAMRRARSDNAERASVMSDLKAARVARLEILADALAPLLAQIPKDVDLFDVALMPGTNPRLFIDMIGFVEMGRDARVYHFLQDTRHGRVNIAASPEVDSIVDAVTDYVARRLLERDRALAADQAAEDDVPPRPSRRPAARAAAPPDVAPAAPRRRTGLGTWAAIVFAFLIDLLGSIAFFSILAGAAWVLWNKFHGHV